MKKRMKIQKIEWMNGETRVHYDLVDMDNEGKSIGTGSFFETKYIPLSEIETFVKNGVKPEKGETIEISAGY